MKAKVIVLAAGILLVASACGVAPTPGPSQPGLETVIAQTLQALTSVAPPVTESVFQGIPVAFENVSFVLPTGLATGANPELVPAIGQDQGAPWEVAPAYKKLTLVGYPLQGKFFEPQILVYPIQEMGSVNPVAADSLEELRGIIADPSVPLNKDDIPGIFMFNAARVFASNMQRVNSQNAVGIRMLTEYAQYYAPINNREMIYEFQGLTNDNAYYVVAILPVNAPFLAADEDPAAALPADGIPVPDLNTGDEAQFTAYYQAVTDRLNATSPSSFQPSLDQLDILIQSINVSP